MDQLSEVDYDPSDTDETEGAGFIGPAAETTRDLEGWGFQPSATVMAPASKRRRLTGKTPPPCIVPEGFVALLPEALPDCHLARSFNARIYEVDFKTMKGKPFTLCPLHVPGHECTQPELFCVAGKEKGQVYYICREAPLAQRHSARHSGSLRRCADSVQETALARVSKHVASAPRGHLCGEGNGHLFRRRPERMQSSHGQETRPATPRCRAGEAAPLFAMANARNLASDLRGVLLLQGHAHG